MILCNYVMQTANPVFFNLFKNFHQKIQVPFTSISGPSSNDYSINNQTSIEKTEALLKKLKSLNTGTASIGAALVLFASAAFLPFRGALLSCSLSVIAGVRGIYTKKKIADCLKFDLPNLSNLYKDKNLSPSLGEPGWIENGFICKDSIVSSQLKLDLIKNANQEILLAGHICSGEFFSQILESLKISLEKNQNLRVHILTEKSGLKSKKRAKEVYELVRKYPNRFNLIISDRKLKAFLESNHSIKYKHIANHTKLLIVDGQYMITGGSVATPSWAIYDGTCPPEKTTKFSFSVKGVIAKAFRDLDICLFSKNPNSIIQTSRLEFYKLLSRWDHYWTYSRPVDPFVLKINSNRKHGWGSESQTLFQPIETTTVLSENKTLVKDFYHKLNHPERSDDLLSLHDSINNQCLVNDLKVQVYTSNPENESNDFANAMRDAIDKATTSITISHQYFHPSAPIYKAIQDALNRNVKITIISNGTPSNAPPCHQIFVPRNRLNYKLLAGFKKHPNLAIYEWNVSGSTYHKKCIVIDSKVVILGSGNLGYKTLITQSDNELNLIIESSELAKQVEDLNKYDQSLCQKISLDTTFEMIPTARELFITLNHRWLQEHIG